MAISSIGGAAQAAVAATTTKVTSSDPRDLNGDGKVTQAEIDAYNLMHGSASTTSTTGSATASTGASALDIYA